MHHFRRILAPQRMPNPLTERVAALLFRMSDGRETDAVAKAKELVEQVRAATDLVLHGGGLSAMREWSGWNHDIEVHELIAEVMVDELRDHGFSAAANDT